MANLTVFYHNKPPTQPKLEGKELGKFQRFIFVFRFFIPIHINKCPLSEVLKGLNQGA
jgi:hypothetical protein